MSLNFFYTMVQKSQKWPKTQIKGGGGPALRFLYKVVQKIGRLQKFNRAHEIKFNFLTAWTIFMKLGTPAHHGSGYKNCLRFFNFDQGLSYGLSKLNKRGEIIT